MKEVEKRCNTCKFGELGLNDAPCKNCHGSSCWESKVTDSGKNCASCKYRYFSSDEEPCRDCGRDEEPVNWVQSIEYYPEDDDRINELEETLEAVRTARDKAEADVLALTVKCENYERYILEHIQKGAVK